MNELCVIVFLLFVVLQVLDVVSTTLALKKPNIVESNKLLKWLMDRVGIVPALVLSKVVAVLIVAAIYLLLPDYRLYLVIGVGVTIPWYVYVIVGNFKNARG